MTRPGAPTYHNAPEAGTGRPASIPDGLAYAVTTVTDPAGCDPP